MTNWDRVKAEGVNFATAALGTMDAALDFIQDTSSPAERRCHLAEIALRKFIDKYKAEEVGADA